MTRPESRVFAVSDRLFDSETTGLTKTVLVAHSTGAANDMGLPALCAAARCFKGHGCGKAVMGEVGRAGKLEQLKP